MRAALTAALVAGGVLVATPAAQAAPTTYYIDCAATGGGSGSRDAPWNDLDSANSRVFHPGDRLLLKRGTTCAGTLQPHGSGTPHAYITIGAYGTGDRPVIDGGASSANPTTVFLHNESYWAIQDLQIRGGFWRSLWIMNNEPGSAIRGFRISNLDVHDQGYATRNKDWIPSTGSIVVEPCAATSTLADVAISNVHTYNSHEVGIMIGHSEKAAVWDPTQPPRDANTPDCHMGLPSGTLPAKDGVSDVRVVHSEADHNESAGIWVSGSSNVLIDHNNLHHNGNAGTTGLSGEGAWWSDSYGVTAQYNESWANKRGRADGGGLDADAVSEKSLIQHNYLHDNDAYCVGIFAVVNRPNHDVTVRDNLCVNNGVNPASRGQGDLATWTAERNTSSPSTISDMRIYGNTFIRTQPGPVFASDSVYAAGDNYFRNNIVRHSVGGTLINVPRINGSPLPVFDHNTYRISGSDVPTFLYGTTSYTGFSAWQAGSGQDTHSRYAGP